MKVFLSRPHYRPFYDCSANPSSKFFWRLGWRSKSFAKEVESMDLVGLVEELKRQKMNSLDIIAEDEHIYAIPDENFGLVLGVYKTGRWPLTEWAHSQLAEKTGIPKKYYDRMLEAEEFELLADNINTWLRDGKRLIRILDGKVRAILSDRYRIIDNYDLVFLALDEFQKKETIEIHRIDLTETMLYIKAIDRTLTETIKEEDIVYGGLVIRNSEVGASALRIEPFILRRVCSNGLILPKILKRIHLGRQITEIDDEISWSNETRELEDKAFWSKVRDVIRATFDKQTFQSWVEKLKESTKIEIKNPTEAVNNIVGHLGLSEEQKQKLLMYFSESTKYGLINAVTNLASQTKNVDEQVRLEEFAGEILQTPLKDFEINVLGK